MSQTWWKFQEAEFFFDRIKEADITAEGEDAVVGTTKDFLGETAGMEISNNKFLTFSFYLSAFLAAYRSITAIMQEEYNNTEGFREWYDDEKEKMKEDSKMRLLLESRNIALHRRITPFCSSLHVKAAQSELTCSVKWFFDESIEDDNEIAKIRDINNVIKTDIVTICHECVEKMKEIVLESERRFASV